MCEVEPSSSADELLMENGKSSRSGRAKHELTPPNEANREVTLQTSRGPTHSEAE